MSNIQSCLHMTPHEFREYLNSLELTLMESRPIRQAINDMFEGTELSYVMTVLFIAIKDAVECSDEKTNYAEALGRFYRIPECQEALKHLDMALMNLQKTTKNAGMTMSLVMTLMTTKVSTPLKFERDNLHE